MHDAQSELEFQKFVLSSAEADLIAGKVSRPQSGTPKPYSPQPHHQQQSSYRQQGPFWIPTTVIFALFVTSTMAESIAKSWSGQAYDYDMTLLSYAGGTVYTYVGLLPLAVWGTAKYFKVDAITLFDMINPSNPRLDL
eukprot:jgi/Hompol1/6453/HPOL_003458-RA